MSHSSLLWLQNKCVHLLGWDRVTVKVLSLNRLGVYVYTDQWSVSPVHRRQTGRRSLTHRNSYTLLWDGGQQLLLFLPSSCHLEVSVLRSHRLFVYALCPSIAQCAEIWSRNLNSVFKRWNLGSKILQSWNNQNKYEIARPEHRPGIGFWSDPANNLNLITSLLCCD